MSVGLAEHPVVSAEVYALYAPLLERLACSSEVDPRRSALVDEAGEVWSRRGEGAGFTAFRHTLNAIAAEVEAAGIPGLLPRQPVPARQGRRGRGVRERRAGPAVH